MNPNGMPEDRDPESLAARAFDESLETMIRAAGGYVAPSENLRPKVLEAARERCNDRKANLQFGRFVIAMSIGCFTMLSMTDRIAAWRELHSVPTSYSIQQRAIEIASEKGTRFDWGLVDSFQELQHDKGASLGLPDSKNLSQ